MAVITLATLRDYWKAVYDSIGALTGVAPSKGILVGGKDASGNLQAIKTDTAGVLQTALTGSIPTGANTIGGVKVLDYDNLYPATSQNPGDGVGIPTYPRFFNGATSFLEACNGATWDRWRNNTEGTLLASAARTATTYSPDVTNYNARGIHAALNITAASGTGGLQVIIQAKDPVSGVYYQLNASPTAITATGLYIYELYPGASSAPSGSTNQYVVQRTAASLPRTFRVAIGHGDATSYTYTVGYALIV